MSDTRIDMQAIANAMVSLHKEQYGRGPVQAHAGMANKDTLVCVLEQVLLPAERKMVRMGDDRAVTVQRTQFQCATAGEFIGAVERISDRTVRAFASGIDAHNNVIFENFIFLKEEDGNQDDPDS